VTALTLVPLALTALGLLIAPAATRRLDPHRAAPLLCAVAVAAAVSTTAALLLVVGASDGRLAGHGANGAAAGSGMDPSERLLEWCAAVYDRGAPRWAALAALGALAVGVGRFARSRRRWHRAVAPWVGAAPLEIVPGDSTVAFAVPGHRGTIVVGQGLLDALEPDEQQVVFAHERAHLGHAHHRYVRIGDLAAAAFPFLRPIARHIRLATERWADEVAAVHVGDRRLVARALIKAALTEAPRTPLPGAATGHVTERVAALLGEPPTARRRSLAAPLSLLAVLLPLAAASIQLHHLGVFVEQAAHAP
jgi:Zn-dependent protease with chaperone function